MTEIFKLEHKKRSTLFGIMITILLLVFLIAYSFIFYLIARLTGFPYMFYIEFGTIIVFAVIFSQKKLIEFTYYLEKRRIRIDRIYSSRPKLDVVIQMKNIAYMGTYKNMPTGYKTNKKQRETFKRIDGNCFCIVHFVEKKYFNAFLSPSLAFEKKMLQKWQSFIDSNRE